jgi:hypothetical protein
VLLVGDREEEAAAVEAPAAEHPAGHDGPERSEEVLEVLDEAGPPADRHWDATSKAFEFSSRKIETTPA